MRSSRRNQPLPELLFALQAALEVLLISALIHKWTEKEFIKRLANVASICGATEEAEFLMLQYSPVAWGSRRVCLCVVDFQHESHDPCPVDDSESLKDGEINPSG